jgi:DNA-binding NtrC family response regulator
LEGAVLSRTMDWAYSLLFGKHINLTCDAKWNIIAMTDDTPIIVFAQSPQERDLLRSILSAKNRRILCFESEVTCFDNLASIEPGAIIVRTDSRIIAWRFVFALHLLRIDARLVILSNIVAGENFTTHGLSVKVQSLSTENEKENLDRLMDQWVDERPNPTSVPSIELLVGETEAIKNINVMLPSLARSSDPVLITGESGTGKELLARMIVQQAANQSIFVKLDCEAIQPECLTNGVLFENAEQGRGCTLFREESLLKTPMTILLHKIDRSNDTIQSEILLLLEEGVARRARTNKNDISGFRVIATSEMNLSDMVRRSCFRKDLYYRLNVLPIYLPPLQQRKDDIHLLMDYFIISASAKLNRSFSIPSGGSRKRILDYHWPGNLEELKCAMDRFVISGDETQMFAHIGSMPSSNAAHKNIYQLFEFEMVPDPGEIQSCFLMSDSLSLKSICDRFACRTEKKLMRKALESTNWNRKKAAALLNISYKSMLNKIKMYEIV